VFGASITTLPNNVRSILDEQFLLPKVVFVNVGWSFMTDKKDLENKIKMYSTIVFSI